MKSMEKNLTRQVIHAGLLVIGLVLMIGGVVTGKHGATVVGMCVSAVNVQQWVKRSKKEKNNNKNQS